MYDNGLHCLVFAINRALERLMKLSRCFQPRDTLLLAQASTTQAVIRYIEIEGHNIEAIGYK